MKDPKLLLLLLVWALHLGCSNAESQDPTMVAQSVCKGVGAPGEVKAGSRGNMVFVLEESHNSRLSHLQQTVVLERLCLAHGLADIGLEGFLQSEASSTSENKVRTEPSIALQMLENGEISSAEFVGLTRGVSLHPIESAEEYFHPDEEVSAAPYVYLLAIATKRLESKLQNNSIDATMRRSLEGLQDAIEGQPEAESSRLIAEFQQSLMEWDPWTRKAMEDLQHECGDEILSIETQLGLLDDIESRARDQRAEIGDEFEEMMSGYRRFLEAREASSRTMVDRVGAIADTASGCVAMVIGAAHTERVVDLLSENNRPFAVITPLALIDCEDSADLGMESYGRLVQGLPMEDGVLERTLVSAFPNNIKPKPISQQEWFKARSEMYRIVSDFVQETLPGGAGGAPPNDTSPVAFGDPERWHGEYISIDSKRAILAVDEETGDRVVVFPVTLNPKNNALSEELWIRASRDETRVQSANSEKKTVEELVLESIERIRRRTREEDTQGKTRTGQATESAVKSLGNYKLLVTRNKEQAMKNLRKL